jgi:hypothetical protein
MYYEHNSRHFTHGQDPEAIAICPSITLSRNDPEPVDMPR